MKTSFIKQLPLAVACAIALGLASASLQAQSLPANERSYVTDSSNSGSQVVRSGFGECWQPANVEFLRRTLSPLFLRERLGACAEVLTKPEHKSLLEHLHLAMEVDADLVSLRCAKLPDLLEKPYKVGGFRWETVGARSAGLRGRACFAARSARR